MSLDNATIQIVADLSDKIVNLQVGLDAAWLMVTGIGIVMMQAGFMALEVGAGRSALAPRRLPV
jgi:hypothetical protein